MEIKKNIKLADFSTFKIGGKAEYFVNVLSPEELFLAIEWAKKRKIGYKIFAGGSNVVFSDKGVKGLVIQYFGGQLIVEDNLIRVDAGVPLSFVVEKAIAHGLQGLEALKGIPGTVGGAAVGNARAYGHSLSEVVQKAEVWDGKRIKWLSKSECWFSYRESIFKKKPYFILRLVLKLKKGNKKQIEKVAKEVTELRRKKYFGRLCCPGSFFKNKFVKEFSKKSLSLIDKSKIIGNKVPVSYLLESVGSKGMRVGGIQVAPFHGNLFFNVGGGTERDVRKLAGVLKKKVRVKFGVELEEEIIYFS